ncbi:MAG: hypothetical protein HGA67_04405 [Candidatus Yonathbacteria bacterium]|nr:hypothetical protein [Candidatus Yonathbacteria bacterium]
MALEQHKDHEESERIEDIKDKLYRTTFTQKRAHLRPSFYTRDTELPSAWKTGDEFTSSIEPKRKGTGLRIFFGFSIFFFVAAAGVAAFMLLGGGNHVSSDKVVIEATGASVVSGGDETSISVKITNDNKVPLKEANIVFAYPSGLHVKDPQGKDIPRDFRTLGAVAPGETKEETIRGVIFGREGENKEITMVMEYKIEGSDAVYTKEYTYGVRIDSAPISITIDSLKEVNAGQETEIKITVTSNTATIVKGLMVKMEYPFGFDPKSANPVSSSGSGIWNIGDLPAGESKIITVRGVIRGQNNDEKTFRAYVGQIDPATPGIVGVLYNEGEATIAVRDLFLGVELALNNEVADAYAIASNTAVRGKITYTNNLSVGLRNVSLELVFDGAAIDKYGVETRDGFYDSAHNTLRWDKTTKKIFDYLDPGETGTIDFSFKTVPLVASGTSPLKNPSIRIKMNIQGLREGEGDVNEERLGAIDRVVNVWSDLQLAARAVYTTGPFENTGGLPPHAGKETTYTILLSAVNSSNTISNTTATAKLPQGVAWKNVYDPARSDITYNASSRTITWRIGRMAGGAGIEGAGPSIALSVGLTPSTTQVGSVAPLLTDITISGDDDFAGKRIIQTSRNLDTNIVSDPNYTRAQGSVAR